MLRIKGFLRLPLFHEMTLILADIIEITHGCSQLESFQHNYILTKLKAS